MFAIASLTTSPTSPAAASLSPHSRQNAPHARRTVAKLAGSLVTFNRSGGGRAAGRGLVADGADVADDSTCGRCCPLARWAMCVACFCRSDRPLPVASRVGGHFATGLRRPRLQPPLPLLHGGPAVLVV